MTVKVVSKPREAGGMPAGLMRFPDDQRDLFELLALYEADAGRPDAALEAWLDRIDLSKATPRALYHVAHRRPADTLNGAMLPDHFDARAPLGAAICSEEFRANAVLNLLHAYPSPGRCVVLTVPGIDPSPVLNALSGVQAVLRDQLGVARQDDAAAFLDTLSRVVRGIGHAGDLVAECVSGLERYQARVGHRPRDRMLIVIDDPVRAMLGQAGAAVARLQQDPEGTAPLTRELHQAMGVAPGVARPGRDKPAELRRLAERALTNPAVCRPDAICRILSHTARKSFLDAVSAAVIFDVEITTRADLPAWLLERWGVVMPHRDEPAQLLPNAEAIEAFSDHLLDMTREDRRFYELITWALNRTGRPGITGQELARVAGAETLQGLAASVFVPSARLPFPVFASRPHLPNPLAATGPDQVLAYLTNTQPLPGLRVGFGAGAASEAHAGAGWSVVEEEARWTNETRAEIMLPHPPFPGPYRLLIDATPFTAQRLPAQSVGVLVNAHAIAVCAMSSRAVLDCAIPDRIIAAREPVRITLVLPDATSPQSIGAGGDDRRLGLYIRSIALVAPQAQQPAPISGPPPATIPEPRPQRPDPDTMPLSELAIQFESIGENCELGLVQRRWGAEPLGLLRFASSPPDKLFPALRQGFRGMGAKGELEVELHGGREYMVLDRRYGFLYHAWAMLGEMTPEEILVREHRRVPFLIRKLMEDVEAGEKLFVYHAMRPLAQREAQELADILAERGAATLLWLELADEDQPPGSVVRINDRLLKGHMDRFAPGENAHDISLDGWLKVCRNALRVWWHG